MDTVYLTAFIATADLSSISLAAEQLNLTQPAVTKRIQNLERLLNVTLFDRSQRTLMLTDAGRELLPMARNIVGEIKNLHLIAQRPGQAISGELSIVCSHHIGLHRLPPVLQRYCEAYPDVKLNFTFAESEKALRKLANQQTDFAFITIDENALKTYQVHLTLTDRMHAVCALNHPLSQHARRTLTDLTEFDAILPDERTYLFSVVNQIFKNHNLTLPINMTTNYLETIKMMVNAGLGWSVIPDLMIDEYLRVLNIPELQIDRRLGIISLKRRLLSRAGQAFVEMTEEVWHSHK